MTEIPETMPPSRGETLPPSRGETIAPRRALAGRSAETVDRLLDAGLALLTEKGYDQLSMREVCRRSGLTHATAYVYFSAKQHLVAEMYWRRVEQWSRQPIRGDTPLRRLEQVFTELGRMMAAEQRLSAAAMAALISPHPDVVRLRTRIGVTLADRLRRAAEPDCTEPVLDALTIALSGAMVQAAMNYSTYDDMARRLTSVAELFLGRDES